MTTTDPAAIQPEDLLRHAGALRALAHRLVENRDDAESLVQETLVRALEHRPRAGHGLAAWLGQVLQNEARQERRAAERRAANEARAAQPNESPAAADVAAQLATQRRLLEAVESLEPIYRDVVFMRWFEDLPPRKIAARLGVPTNTVKTRLERAHARLRARLESVYRDRHESWATALAAIALPARSKSLPLLLTAGAVMNLKFLVPAVAGITALGMLAFWSDGGAADSNPIPDAGPTAPATARMGEPETHPEHDPIREHVPLDTSDVAAGIRDDAIGPRIRGRVFDAAGTPQAGIDLQFVPQVPSPGDRRVLATSDANGHFEMAKPSGSGMVFTASENWTTLLAGEPGPDTSVIVVVASARRTAGLVVDARTDQPVGDATVTVRMPEGFRARFPQPLDNTADQTWTATTNADGRFTSEGIPAIAGCRVTAEHDGYLDTSRVMGLEERELRFELVPADEVTSIAGVVLDAAGETVANARVALGRQPTRTDAQGGFELVVEGPSPDRLTAVALGWQPKVIERTSQPATEWPDWIEVRLTDTPESIRGRVLRADGRPHDSAEVWVHDPTYFAQQGTLALSAEREMHTTQELWQRVTTDDHGEFSIPGLLAREYEVRAVDLRTLEQVHVRGVRAGGAGIELRFSADGVLPRLEGRIVDSRGQPVPEVDVQLTAHGFIYGAGQPGAMNYVCPARGPQATSDSNGVFEFENVTRRAYQLGFGFSSERVLTGGFTFVDGLAVSPIEVVVQLRCRVRVDVSGSDLEAATKVRFVDARDEPVAFERATAKRTYIEKSTYLSGGKSEFLTLPDTACEAVFELDGIERGRRPVRPDPNSTVIVRP